MQKNYNIIRRLIKDIWLHTQRKMERISLTYGLPKGTVRVLMMLYKNAKVKVRSPDEDEDNFDIVTGMLKENYLASYIFYYLTRLRV